MEFASTPVPYRGAAGLREAKKRALRHAEATAERFGYAVTDEPSYAVTGGERGGVVVATVTVRPVARSW